MCVLCSQVWVDEHWADAAAVAGNGDGDIVVLETHAARRGQRLRDRVERARCFNLVLSAQGLTLHLQDREGSRYIVRDAKGSSAVVANLAQVWEAAERMLGRPVDPLDPELLRALSTTNNASATEQ